MTDTQSAQNTLEYLNSIGTAGLALVVVVLYKILMAIQRGDWVARRELEASVVREQKLDQRLERALHIGDRAMDASDKLAERLPAKH